MALIPYLYKRLRAYGVPHEQATIMADPVEDGDYTGINTAVQSYLDSNQTGTVLSGSGAPGSGSGLDPLDGVSDPWRWSNGWGGWISPAYELTWVQNDTIPTPAAVSGAEGASPAVTVIEGGVGLFDSATYTATPSVPVTASSAGSGIGFVVVYETGFAHTAMPDPTLAASTMFGDFTVGAPYEFPDVTTGSDGQWYIDLATKDLYGPRTAGVWSKFSTLPPPV